MHHLKNSREVITNLGLERATDSSEVLQSPLGVLHYLCFAYVLFLGNFTELNMLGNKSDNTLSHQQSWRYQIEGSYYQNEHNLVQYF